MSRANPLRMSKGELQAGGFIVDNDIIPTIDDFSNLGIPNYRFKNLRLSNSITFNDGTSQSTSASPTRYISCFDLTTQEGSTTTPTPYKFNTTDVSRDINVVSDGTNPTKIKVDVAGVYNFIWSGQFENTVNEARDIFVWWRINGEDVVGSTGLAAVPGSHGGVNGHALIGWNFFLTLAAGDEVQLMWMKEVGINLPYYAATANYPSTASVVLTVNQIA